MTGSRFLQRCIFKRFHLFWKEEETMAGQHTFIPLLPPGIVVQRDNEIYTVLEILLDGLDSGSLPFEHDIHSVGQRSLSSCSPAARAQADTISGLHFSASNQHRLRRRVILAGKAPICAAHTSLPYPSMIYCTLNTVRATTRVQYHLDKKRRSRYSILCSE